MSVAMHIRGNSRRKGNVLYLAVSDLSKIEDGVEIATGFGCQLETIEKQKMNPDCMLECKQRMPPCVAYSYNNVTKLCTIASGCMLVDCYLSSNASVHYIGKYCSVIILHSDLLLKTDRNLTGICIAILSYRIIKIF